MATKAHGKKYLEAAKLVDPEKLYEAQEAVSLLKKMNYVKFDPTLEVHMKLGVDPRHADQMVRGVAMLPAGSKTSAEWADSAAPDASRCVGVVNPASPVSSRTVPSVTLTRTSFPSWRTANCVPTAITRSPPTCTTNGRPASCATSK